MLSIADFKQVVSSEWSTSRKVICDCLADNFVKSGTNEQFIAEFESEEGNQAILDNVDAFTEK